MENEAAVLKTIIQLFGNPKINGKAVKNLFDFHDWIVAGILTKVALHIQQRIGLIDEELAVILGISKQKLVKLNKGRLPIFAGDRLYRFVRICAVAKYVLEDEKNIMFWLRHESLVFGRRAPLEMLMTKIGADEVENELWRLDAGVYT